MRSSDSAQGSRVTITSDGELNDYSAYRSGDRFIVVIPQAQGGGGEGARGRGFEGAQVSRRGSDLVYTFKLQPGASAKVSQKFNRLDVQFTAGKGSEIPAGAQTTPTSAATPRTPAELAGIKPTASPTPTRANTSSATNQPQLVPTPAAVAANPNNVSPSFPSIGTTPAPTPSVAPSAAPSVAPATTPVQVAQAQTTPAAPVNIVSPSTVATTSTLGTFVQRNWHWFIGALLIVGVGLLLVTRLGERQTTPAPPLKSPELRAAKTVDDEVTLAKPRTVAPAKPQTAAAEPVKVAPAAPPPEVATSEFIAPLAAATAPVAARTKKDRKEKRGKKGKKGHAVAESAANVEAAHAAPVEAAMPPPAQPDESTRVAAAADSAVEVSDVLTPAAILAGAGLVEAKLAGASAAEVDDAPAADTERVGEEIGKLFAGEAYDESVVGARDRATREMVSSELLAGLSSRNERRNERARAAFLKHGYFEDATRDLQSAEAPAQRASAAHALSLLRDRSTTSHLVAALEDPSSDVRRASVEALAELRDPSALGPLEALRWRETSRQVPRALILRAVEACTPSVEETEAALVHEGATSAPEIVAPDDAPISEAVAEPADATSDAPVLETSDAVVLEATTLEATTPAAESATPDAFDPADAFESTHSFVSPDAPDETFSDVTVETAAAVTAVPVEEDEEFEMIAGVEVPRPPRGVTESVHEAAVEFEETPALEAPAAESFVETTHEQFFAPDDVVTEQVAAEPEVFGEREVEATDAAETTAAVESPAFVEPRVEEIEATEGVAAAALAQAVEERAPAEPAVVEATGSAAPVAPDETVYTFEEGEASDWSAPRGGDATPEAWRGTGGLDEREPARFEGFDNASDETAEHAPAVYAAPEFAAVASGEMVADDWLDVDVEEQPVATAAPPQVIPDPGAEFETRAASPAQIFEPTAEPSIESTAAASAPRSAETFEDAAQMTAPVVAPPSPSKPARSFVPDAGEDSGTGVTLAQKGIELSGIEPEDVSTIPKSIQLRLESEDTSERAASVRALARLDTDEGFQQICAAFDDPAQEVRDAAARALHDASDDRAESFTRALRESPAERRRSIGASLASSGLAEEAVSQLTGESREKTYDAFSLLFLMAKAGETAPLIRAVESHPENEVRLAVVKLLALSGQQDVLPSFKRLAVRGSLPNEVRSAVMEAIYQISSSNPAQQPPPKPARTV